MPAAHGSTIPGHWWQSVVTARLNRLRGAGRARPAPPRRTGTLCCSSFFLWRDANRHGAHGVVSGGPGQRTRHLTCAARVDDPLTRGSRSVGRSPLRGRPWLRRSLPGHRTRDRLVRSGEEPSTRRCPPRARPCSLKSTTRRASRTTGTGSGTPTVLAVRVQTRVPQKPSRARSSRPLSRLGTGHRSPQSRPPAPPSLKRRAIG